MKALLLVSLVMIVLSGCSRGLVIDQTYSSQNHDSRVQYVILHYTSSGFERSLNSLTLGGVSSHYLINEQPPTIYQLVDENRRAWHAGASSWQGRTWLNSNSIGIEMVHPGYTDTPEGRLWHPWEPSQIDSLIPLLQDILRRHNLSPDRVIGHSDVAPQRKVDPGPLFPWQRLAEAGVAIWPDATRVTQYEAQLAGMVPPLAWFQEALGAFGYEVPTSTELDRANRNVIAAFQMRFRPGRHDGEPDSQTAAILAALVPVAVESALWCLPEPTPCLPAAQHSPVR